MRNEGGLNIIWYISTVQADYNFLSVSTWEVASGALLSFDSVLTT